MQLVAKLAVKRKFAKWIEIIESRCVHLSVYGVKTMDGVWCKEGKEIIYELI